MTRMGIDPSASLWITKLGWRFSGRLLVEFRGVLPPALVAGGVVLQVPPHRFAPVGMTKLGVAFQRAFASGV